MEGGGGPYPATQDQSGSDKGREQQCSLAANTHAPAGTTSSATQAPTRDMSGRNRADRARATAATAMARTSKT
jgi:hypothetical protein